MTSPLLEEGGLWSSCTCARKGKKVPKLVSGKIADEKQVARLVREGKLPIIAVPRVDLEGDNGIKQVFMAEYDGGVELTIIFDDEDRPHPLSDLIYDLIRQPLFGRSEDIESIFINGTPSGDAAESIDFPGTYADGATWQAVAPLHGHATVPIAKFESRPCWEAGQCPVVWTNTWSHLFGETNANPGMDMVFYSPAHAADALKSLQSLTALPEDEYPVYHGSRADVDSKFHGLVGSFAKTMSIEKRTSIGREKTRHVLDSTSSSTSETQV
jgi:hypothetical protein